MNEEKIINDCDLSKSPNSEITFSDWHFIEKKANENGSDDESSIEVLEREVLVDQPEDIRGLCDKESSEVEAEPHHVYIQHQQLHEETNELAQQKNESFDDTVDHDEVTNQESVKVNTNTNHEESADTNGYEAQSSDPVNVDGGSSSHNSHRRSRRAIHRRGSGRQRHQRQHKIYYNFIINVCISIFMVYHCYSHFRHNGMDPNVSIVAKSQSFFSSWFTTNKADDQLMETKITSYKRLVDDNLIELYKPLLTRRNAMDDMFRKQLHFLKSAKLHQNGNADADADRQVYSFELDSIDDIPEPFSLLLHSPTDDNSVDQGAESNSNIELKLCNEEPRMTSQIDNDEHVSLIICQNNDTQKVVLMVDKVKFLILFDLVNRYIERSLDQLKVFEKDFLGVLVYNPLSSARDLSPAGDVGTDDVAPASRDNLELGVDDDKMDEMKGTLSTMSFQHLLAPDCDTVSRHHKTKPGACYSRQTSSSPETVSSVDDDEEESMGQEADDGGGAGEQTDKTDSIRHLFEQLTGSVHQRLDDLAKPLSAYFQRTETSKCGAGDKKKNKRPEVEEDEDGDNDDDEDDGKNTVRKFKKRVRSFLDRAHKKVGQLVNDVSHYVKEDFLKKTINEKDRDRQQRNHKSGDETSKSSFVQIGSKLADKYRQLRKKINIKY